MVTIIPQGQDMRGLSTDTKPTEGVRNGSVFIEMDTQTLYAFDEANGEWIAQNGVANNDSADNDSVDNDSADNDSADNDSADNDSGNGGDDI